MAKFDYNDEVRITEGRHEGRTGVIVSLPTQPAGTYAVEFGDGSDASVHEAQLVLVAGPESR
jgi:ribosomal protein S4E